MQPTSELNREFVTFFVVIDPIGCSTVFLYATQEIPAEKHNLVAVRGVVAAGVVLLLLSHRGRSPLSNLAMLW